MDILISPDQELIVDSIETFLAEQFPASRLAGRDEKSMPCANDQLASLGEMGWLASGLGEAAGGMGLGMVDQILIFRAYGRHLAPIAVLANVIAADVAARASMPDVAAGLGRSTMRACLAVPLPRSKIGPTADGEFLLLDSHDAAFAAMVCPDGAGLVALDRRRPCTHNPGSDETVSVERVRFEDIGVIAWTDGPAADLRSNLLVAAMLVGICEATRDMSIEYAKTRVQFGKPIGSFQAIKHKCADMAVQTEAIEQLLSFAAICQDTGRHDAAFQTSSVRLLSADYAIANASANIQVHGAIGFTAELPAHLFLKRAHLLAQLGGSRRHHQSAILALPSAQSQSDELRLHS